MRKARLSARRVSETIRFGELFRPWNYALSWSLVAFLSTSVITISLRAFGRWTWDDVAMLWTLLCLPATLITLLISWAHLHGLANQWRVVTIDRRSLIVREPRETRTIELANTSWYDGYSFSDYQLRFLAARKAIVVSFPPFGPTDKIAMGWSDECAAHLRQRLQRSGARYCGARHLFEREMHVLFSVGGAVAHVIALICGAWLCGLIGAPNAIPTASWASTALFGARLGYEVSRHFSGDSVSSQGDAHWIIGWIALCVVSVLRINIRMRQAPILLDPTRLASAAGVAVFQVATAVLIYTILKRRESQRSSV